MENQDNEQDHGSAKAHASPERPLLLAPFNERQDNGQQGQGHKDHPHHVQPWA